MSSRVIFGNEDHDLVVRDRQDLERLRELRNKVRTHISNNKTRARQAAETARLEQDVLPAIREAITKGAGAIGVRSLENWSTAQGTRANGQ